MATKPSAPASPNTGDGQNVMRVLYAVLVVLLLGFAWLMYAVLGSVG